MSEPRTTVDQTEVETSESERNRVAWNLPRGARAAPSRQPNETAGEWRGSRDATDEAAKHGE